MLQTQSHDPSTVTRCIRHARGVRKGAWLHSIGYVYSQKLQLSLWAVAFAAIRPSTSLGDTVVYVFRVTFASDTQPQLTNVEFYSNVLSICCYGMFVSVFRVASSRIQETEATLYYLSLSIFVCLFVHKMIPSLFARYHLYERCHHSPTPCRNTLYIDFLICSWMLINTRVNTRWQVYILDASLVSNDPQ